MFTDENVVTLKVVNKGGLYGKGKLLRFDCKGFLDVAKDGVKISLSGHAKKILGQRMTITEAICRAPRTLL